MLSAVHSAIRTPQSELVPDGLGRRVKKHINAG